jgi:PAS domain S-box-containing protein
MDWRTTSHLGPVLMSLAILAGAALVRRRSYRPQAGTILAGILLPTMGLALARAGSPPLFSPEAVPLLLAAGFLIAGWGLFRSRRPSVIPAAQQRLFEELGDAAMVLDAGDRVVDLNPAAQQTLGCATADVVGQPFAQVCSAWPELLKLVRDGKEARQEILVQGEEGPRHLEVRLSNLDGRGHPAGRLLVLRDVTEQKQAAELLREKEHRLEQAVEVLEAVTKGTEVIVSAQDTDFRYIFFNKAYKEEIQRLGGKELEIGSSMVDIFAHMPEQQAVAVNQWSQALHGESSERRIEFGDPDRYRRVYSVRRTPLWDAQGNVVGAGEVAFDITGQVQAEEALREQREWLRVTLSSIGDGVIATDRGGQITFLNPVAAALTGWGQDEALGQPVHNVLQIVDEKTRQPADDIVARALSEKRAVAMANDTVLVTRDGRHMPIEDSAAPILDAAGDVTGVVVVFHDVTDKRRALEALRESEERFRTIYDTAPASIWQEDWTAVIQAIEGLRAEGVTDFAAYFQDHPGFVADMLQVVRILDVNQWTVDMFEARHKAEVLASLGTVFATPDTLPGFVAELTALAAGQSVFRTEMDVNTVRGDTRHVLLAMSFPPRGSGSGNVLVSTIDITARKQAEEALHSSEQHYRRLFDTMLQGVVYQDADGKIISMNPAAERILGQTRDEFLGQSSVTVEHNTLREDGSPFPGMEHPAMVALRTGREVRNVVMGVYNPREEQYRWITITAVPLLLPGEERPYQVYTIFDDITERKLREEELRRLNRTLTAHSHSDQALLRATTEAEFMQEVCRIIVEDCGHAMVWVGFAEEDEAKTVRPVVYAGFEEGYLETLHLTWADTERGRGPTGTAIRTTKPSFCRDMLTDPQFAPWREEALRRGYASSLVLPLLENGRAFGALSIYFREPDPFTEDEIDLLVGLADDLAYGIRIIRLREAHAQAEQALRESEKRYRDLFNGMTEGFSLHEIVTDAEGTPCDYRFLEINPAFERLTGLKKEDLLGRTVLEALPGTEPFWIETYGRVALTGEPTHFEQYSRELDRHYEVRAFRPAERQFAALFLDITFRKRAEDALRESEERFRSLAEGLPELVWVSDADGKTMYLNRQYRDYASAEPGAPEEWEELVHPEDLPRVTELWNEAIRTGSDFHDEYRMRRHDGQYRWFLTHCVLKRTPAGEIEGWIGAATDIHDQKQAEEILEQRVRERMAELAKANADLQSEMKERRRAEAAVRAERQRFNDILEILPAYLVLLTPDYHVPFANRSFRERFGSSDGERCFEYLFGRTEPCEICETYSVLETNAPHRWEWLGPDGRTYDVFDFPFTDTDGSRLILEMGIDITERKRAQEALQEAHDLLEVGVEERTAQLVRTNALLQVEIEERRKAEEALRRAHDELERRVVERTAELQASEERFRQLAESIQQVFWMLEPATQRLLYVSPAYDVIWGRSSEELYDQPLSFLDTVHPDDRQQVVQGFSADWRAYDGEFRIVRPDGAPRWIRIRSFPIRDEMGDVYRLAGVATDLTEQKAAEAALIQAERLAIAGKMAASLVHEINNPLQSVIGCLGLAKTALEKSEDPGKYVEIAHQEVRRTAQIVGQLRSLGRPGQRGKKEPADLNSLVSDVLTLNKKQLQNRNIQVIWEPDVDLAPVAAMPDALRQVFLNLVLNAIDAMPAGGQLQVSTARTLSPAGVRVVVADSGVGIAPEDLPQLFEAFHSTKAQGIGLGLFVSQNLVQQHGGRIEAESQPGVGTTFSVWLPT